MRTEYPVHTHYALNLTINSHWLIYMTAVLSCTVEIMFWVHSPFHSLIQPLSLSHSSLLISLLMRADNATWWYVRIYAHITRLYDIHCARSWYNTCISTEHLYIINNHTCAYNCLFFHFWYFVFKHIVNSCIWVQRNTGHLHLNVTTFIIFDTYDCNAMLCYIHKH